MQGAYLFRNCVLLVELALLALCEVMAPASMFDLTQHVDWNLTAMNTVPAQDGHATAYLLQGSNRNLAIKKTSGDRMKQLLSTVEDFTITASIKQKDKTSGSIVSFISHRHRYLELESSGKRDELRLHYSSGGQMHTEIFPYKLADETWHKLTLSFTKSHIQLYVDCNKIYERSLKPLDRHLDDTVEIWLGQRNARHAHFKGVIEYVKLSGTAQGLVEQCPFGSVACPSCSQFTHLEYSVKHLYEQLETLTKKLQAAEKRIWELEQCECQRSCVVNGTSHQEGHSWHPDHCTQCTCHLSPHWKPQVLWSGPTQELKGHTSCEPRTCPPVACNNPVTLDGHCCPICLKHCFIRGTYYDHGEGFSPRTCVQCVCKDGKMSCEREDPRSCPRPDCPRHQQFTVPGQCCKYCRGTDYCSLENPCHMNATCINLATRHSCQCNQGYTGNGQHCQDRDECLTQGGRDGHHCRSNTVCVNTPGSYSCNCLPGFFKTDEFTCQEKDECATGEHGCSEHATCLNTHGSYQCSCVDGYSGDGKTCFPVCLEECKNGGECVSPGHCRCRKGFLGRSCDQDLNECELGVAECHRNSYCVNLPGSYQCRCRRGFYSVSTDNRQGALCLDIDECSGWAGGHKCPTSTQCINTDGGYQCVCTDPLTCSTGCEHKGQFYRDGAAWQPEDEVCSLCTCQSGTTVCEAKACDCGDSAVDTRCCPHCDAASYCVHQELPVVLYSGDTWTYQCHTCHCLDGETECSLLACPRLSCEETEQVEGDCCPRCKHTDPCHVDVPLNSRHVCLFKGQTFRPGDTWTLRWDPCTTCHCKGGHVCCTYDQMCSEQRARDLVAKEPTLSLSQTLLSSERYRRPPERAIDGG